MKKYLFRLTSFFLALFFVVSSASAAVTLPSGTGLSSDDLATVITRLTNWILGIFGFLAIISFLVSGIMYFLAAGDDKAQEKAKKQMTWSIVGVVIGLSGLVVITAINLILSGS